AQSRDPIMLVGAGDVEAPLLLASAAAGEDAIRIGLRVPAGAVIRRREARTGKAVLIDRAIIEAKIIARDIAEGALFISGLEPELVARGDKIGIQFDPALNRETVGIAGQGREGKGGWRRGKSRASKQAGAVLMGGRRQLHRAPGLIIEEIAGDVRHPRPRWLTLEGDRRNAVDRDRR